LKSRKAIVYIVDDEYSICDALKGLLSALDFCVKAYTRPEKFLKEVNDRNPGCILLDLKMPGMGGFEVQSRLNEMGVQLPVLFLTGYGDVPSSVRAFRAGAENFLEKPVRNSELISNIREAIRKEEDRRHRDAETSAASRQLATLTRREREVYGLVVRGFTNRKIGSSLGITEKTVKVHRQRVMQKMKVSSLAELARLAERLEG